MKVLFLNILIHSFYIENIKIISTEMIHKEVIDLKNKKDIKQELDRPKFI